MNQVTLIGRLGKDPAAKDFQNGGRVVSFTLATSERWKDKSSGEQKERTEWHNIQIFNEGLGKVAERYLRKGNQCMVQGQIQSREYTDKDGVQRKAFEIVVPRFGGSLELLGGKNDGGGDSGERRPANSNDNLSQQLDDDIPF